MLRCMGDPHLMHAMGRRRSEIQFILFEVRGRNPLFWLLAAALVTGGCAATPAAPKVHMDLSSPTAAAGTFTRAIAAADAAGAKAASTGTDEQKQSIDALVGFIDGLRAYDQALMKHFGPRAIQVHTQIRQALEDIAEQPVRDFATPLVTQNDNQATVRAAYKNLKLSGRPPLVLTKTKAGWKVDLAATARYDQRFTPAVAREYRQASLALHQTARQVAAGKFRTVDEAQQGAAQ